MVDDVDTGNVELEGIKLSWELIKTILVELLKGKSLDRTLMNYSLSWFELSGNILDLGSGSDSASYNRFLKYKEPYNVTYSDYYSSGKNIIKLDLEKPFKIEQNTFDYIMCFNTLEHIYNFRNVVRESYKILGPEGVFIGGVPFMVRHHPDPNDYFRFSHQALLKMFEEEGYICQRMVSLGFGPFSVAVSQWIHLMPKILGAIFIFLPILLDTILIKIFDHYKMKYPLGYLFVFKKR